MSSNQKALKSGAWYTASNFLVKGIGFLTTPIFTKLLTHADFGSYNNFTSWLSLISIIVTLNLEATLMSARYDYESDLDSYIFSLISLSSLSAIVWICIANTFKDFFQTMLDMNIIYINVMLVYLIFTPVVNMYQSKAAYFFEYKKNVFASLMISIGTALLSVVLVCTWTDKLKGRIIGSVLPTILIGIIFYIYFWKKGRKINFSYWRYAILICLPYIPHLLSMTLLNSTDRVMITKICGSEQTALYSLAYTCGTMITLLLTSLNGAFAPWLGEHLNQEKYREIRRFSNIYILAFLFFAVGIMLVSPEVLYILGGESYMEAVYVLAPVSMGCVCQFLYTMFVNVEQFKKKTVGMAIGSAIAAFINLVLNLIFIPQIGYLAAAYTTLGGYLVLLLIHMYLVKRLGLSEIYDYKFIGAIVLVGIVVMILITTLYSHTILRYIVMGIYGCVALYIFVQNKNKIVSLLKNRS